MSFAENTGAAFKKILERLKETESETITKEELPHTCNNCKHCHGIELNSKEPYINNRMIDFLLDNCMGNLSCMWWNH